MKQQKPGIITLLTDFGDSDGYVGSMKGVIMGLRPEARVVDVSHRVSPFHILSAAFVLKSYYRFFPPGTVHVVVVDPGVGGERECLAVKAGGYYFVAPDNGVLTYALWEDRKFRAYAIENPRYMLEEVSETFHGRDIFAPAAAHLAGGARLSNFGGRVEEPVGLSGAFPVVSDRVVTGGIVHIDHFGNLITNITREHLGGHEGGTVAVRTAGTTVIGMSRTYGSREPGEVVVYFGSSGHLEIGAVEDNASFALRAGVGDEVRVILKGKRKKKAAKKRK